MELRDLRFFCLAAETEHLTRTAEKIGISQPSLTRIIGLLEEEAGGKLFERVGRNIRLTPNGEIFYRGAKKVLDDIDLLRSEMDYEFDRRSRTVTLLCNTEVFTSWMVHELKKTKPSYSVSVHRASMQEMRDALTSGNADFVFCCPPIPESDGETFKTEVAFFQDALILLPPDHPLLGKPLIALEDLRDEPLITMQKNSGMRNLVDKAFEDYGYQPNIVCETNNTPTIIQSVAAGLGYAFVTKLIMADYPEMLPNCAEIALTEKRGYFGLSYMETALNDRNNAHFHDFIIPAFERLDKELYGEY